MLSNNASQAASITCSAASETHAEPLAGTAAVARAWLCLEQPGPWGHNAVVESRLDSELGRELSQRAETHGIRVQLMRRPGKPDSRSDRSRESHETRRVYLAHSAPETSWLRATTLTDPADLLDLDFERIAEGEHDGWGEPMPGPVLLVCTNGRRDQCCAVRGRAVAQELAQRHGEAVWETSHTGGHRFAPAGVVLPTGFTYGRLDADSSDAALAAASAGKVALDQCRGRSAWSRAGQAADIALREHLGETHCDAITVTSEAGDEVRLAHHDGRQWRVSVHQRELEPARPNSCGKQSGNPVAFLATDVRELTNPR